MTVVRFADEVTASLEPDGRLRSRERPDAVIATDEQGGFSFAPVNGRSEFVAAGEAGFARATDEALQASGNLSLQPWAEVRGRLVKDGQPLAGEPVQMDFARPPLPQGGWLWLPGTTTDDAGRFVLPRVPPEAVRICTRQRITDNPGIEAWTNRAQLTCTPIAGESLDVGDVAVR